MSGGAIQLLGSTADETISTYSISLDTAGVVTAGSGISVRRRERFEILVEPSYPHAYPSVMVRHRRWAGTPHVQWGSVLCLYAAPSVEWNPADGMRGLISRLMSWVQRAAAGELDPAGQPLHPPIAYGSYKNGWIVLRPDLGDLVPWRDLGGDGVRLVYAWCVQRGSGGSGRASRSAPRALRRACRGSRAGVRRGRRPRRKRGDHRGRSRA